tara:strand:+ start:1187 stop:1465 length:279 start_codon:yes stop_codon:yes gene_type:complete
MIVNLISFLSGFLFSSILDTTLGEFQEWAIVGAALIVSTIENLSKTFYFIYFKSQLRKSNKKYLIIYVLDIVQFFKIGLIYGLIVDAFKLGS